MIKGTPTTIQAVAKLADKDSRLPIASPDYPCVCGYHLIEVADYDDETVRCTACGAVTPAGDRAATIQVQRVRKVDAATATYDGGAELEEKIAKAKGKADKDKSDDEKALAKVEVAKEPKAKEINR